MPVFSKQGAVELLKGLETPAIWQVRTAPLIYQSRLHILPPIIAYRESDRWF